MMPIQSDRQPRLYPHRLVVFAPRLWHNARMSVFLERFLLTILSGAFLVIIGFGKSLKFDTTQRVCGCILAGC